MASYIGKNINMVLLLLLIGIVILLVSITIFFQFGLKTRTSAYEATSENLSTCENKLGVCLQTNVEKEKQLNSTAQDIKRYDIIYEGKVAELEDVQNDLSKANARIKSLELIKAGLESEKTALQQTINTKTQEINNLNTQIDNLESDVDYWKAKWNCCKDAADCSSEC